MHDPQRNLETVLLMSDVTSIPTQTEEAPAPLQFSAPGVSAAVETETKSPYLAISPVPVVEGGQGVRFDFNDGARVMVPDIAPEIGQWHVRL